MTKNQKTYLLLGGVVLIWGFLGFRVVRTIAPAVPETNPLQKSLSFKPSESQERDTFYIAANYRDPFLGTIAKPKTKKSSPSAIATKKQIPQKNIVYQGFVAGQTKSNSLFFISIDGQQHMLQVRQTANGVKLLSGNSTAIKVRSQGKTVRIPISE
ncbi:hypothetical protein [Poritiphilus flavus]|uniref:Type II secretion system protein GspC N-terminal domain-containing protein n=1 Tax=Poritiphilus flavus TaxID=2697053 RepID=A0A6L9EE46_9FLAO|nr:hypothetical protein [Poritiphilus flavus]NAS12911.1 hypothetical protein [Poritiphilus flavus]